MRRQDFAPLCSMPSISTAHELASTMTLPSYVTLHPYPTGCLLACGKGCLRQVPLPFTTPPLISRRTTFPQLQQHEGIYAIGEDWLGGLVPPVTVTGATGWRR